MIPVKDLNENVVLDHEEFIRPGTTVETLGGLKPSFAAMGEMGGFDAVALQKYHWVEKIDHVHTPGNSSGIVDGASLLDDRQRADRRGPRPDPARRGSSPRPSRARTRRSCSPAPRRRAARRWRRRASPSISSTWWRSTRRSPRWCCASSGTWAWTWRRSTSTAARSRWVTRWGRPAGMILGTLDR